MSPDLVAELVVDALEGVRVGDDERDAAAPASAMTPSMARCRLRRLRSPVSGSCSARWARRLRVATPSSAVAAELAKARSVRSRSGVGTSRSVGSSGQITPSRRPSSSRSGTSSQWWSQPCGPRPLRARRVQAVQALGGAGVRLLEGEQHAALRVHLGRPQALEVGERKGLTRHAVRPVRGRSGAQLVPLAQQHGHALEAERVADALAGRGGDPLAGALGGEAAGDAQQLLDVLAVPARRLRVLGGLDRHARLRRRSDEDVEVAVRRAPAGGGLVDAEHAEDGAGQGAQRDEQGVLGAPGVRIVGGDDRRDVGERRVELPVEGAVGDEVRAAALEALVDELRPLLRGRARCRSAPGGPRRCRGPPPSRSR